MPLELIKYTRQRLNQISAFHESHILIEGPILGVFATLIAMSSGLAPKVSRMIGLCTLMVTWWLSGAVRMGITGLMPIVCLPLLGISSGGNVSSVYFSNGVVVCWGSMVMASAVEKYGLHKRIATALLQFAALAGSFGVICGFVLITGFLSMWLSNTATAALMVPLANAALEDIASNRPGWIEMKVTEAAAEADKSPEAYLYDRIENKRKYVLGCLAICIDLGIAFGASLGGMATLTGTGSNLVLQGTLQTMFGRDGEITFLQWLFIGFPISCINLTILCGVLVVYFQKLSREGIRPPASVLQSSGDTWGSNSVVDEEDYISFGGAVTINRHKSNTAGELVMELPQLVGLKVEGASQISRAVNRHPPTPATRCDNRVAISTACRSFDSVERTDSNCALMEWVGGEDRIREDGIREDGVGVMDHSAMATAASVAIESNKKYSSCADTLSDVGGSEDTSTIGVGAGSPVVAISYPEWIVMLTFTAMAALWITRDPPGHWGWVYLFPGPEMITDGTVALGCCLLLFITPNTPPTVLVGLYNRFWYDGDCSDERRMQQQYSGFLSKATHSMDVLEEVECYRAEEEERDTVRAEAGLRSNSTARSDPDNWIRSEDERQACSTILSHCQSSSGSRSTRSSSSPSHDSYKGSHKSGSILLPVYNPLPSLEEQSEGHSPPLPLRLISTPSSLYTDPKRRLKGACFDSKHTAEEEQGEESCATRIHCSKTINSEKVFMNEKQIDKLGSRAILDWSVIQELNWDVVFLLGGGFALSLGFQDSGLSTWLSRQIVNNGPSSLEAVIVTASFVSCGATNIMSNIASANILLPALACVGPHHGKGPLLVLAPVTMAASLALLFPVATPPNAIVLGNGRVSVQQMLRVGGVVTACCLSTVLLYGLFVTPLLFDVNHVSESIIDACSSEDF